MHIPVFVINLKHSAERRNHTTKRLNELGVPFQIVEAIDGNDLSDEEIRNNPDFGIYKWGLHSSYLRKEEIGCVLSHLKILRLIVEKEIDMACILEDDNDYLKDFKDILFNVSLNIVDWDILYLGHHSACSTKEAQNRKKKQLTQLDYFIGEPVEVPYGAYAYIINNEAAKKILNHAYPIRLPFDSYIGNAVAIGIRTFLLSPPCVVNNSIFVSTIYRDQNVNYSTPFWKVAGTFIKRIYLWFPFLRKIRVWIFINRNRIFRSLRKTGLIKNHYAKI